MTEFDQVAVHVPFVARQSRTAEAFDARVLAIVGPTAALEPSHHVETLSLPERVEGALLSFRYGRALVGLKGTRAPRPDTGDVRFTVGDGVQLHRRSATRVKASLPVTLHRAGTAGDYAGTTVDLSPDGVLVETDLTAAIGDLLDVSISLAGGDQGVECRARVVRQGGGLIAVQLRADERAARSRLGSFVLEHNCTLLRAQTLVLADVDF